MNRIILADSVSCTGCAACASACPTNSITMKEDKDGFLQPKIDKNTCVECHKCEKICPILNKETVQYDFETKAYAAINKDEAIRAKSSSGGVFYALAKWIIEHGGVVFGARFDEKWEVKHDYSENLEGLIPFMGSKYVQSRIGNSYKQAKSFLEQGRWVLFSGTPCQLGGLRSFLNKEYEKLIQVDLICHGVPSVAVWRSYLNEIKKEGVITKVTFREKHDGWLNYKMVVEKDFEAVVFDSYMDNVFFRGFLKDVYLRRSCYNCQYRMYHRSTDITLADYWGVERLCPEMYDNKGTSMVLTHTSKGEMVLLELGKNEVETLPQSKDDVAKYNPCLDRENPKDLKRKRFFRVFRFTSFERASFVIDKDPFDKRILRKIKKTLKF